VSPQDRREATLRRVLRDARTEEPVDVDWARVEERLLHEARRAPRPAQRASYGLVWVALAAAAAVALWIASSRAPSHSTQTPPALVAAKDPLRRDGDQLALGERVTAAERTIAVAHAGRASWSLSPNSSAQLIERGERISLRLERGSVLSEVVPSAKPETFVVEAAGARIAVHGTVFRVSLEGQRVLVQVREGVVAVGPRGSAPAFLLKAPAAGDFSADGRSGNIDGQPVGEPEAPRSERLKQARARTSSAVTAENVPAPDTAASDAAPLPNEPSIDEIEKGIARIVDVTSDCFRRYTQSADGVQITVRTALSLRIAATGAVTDAQFQPPLSPDAAACAATSISHIAFAPSAQGTQVTRLLELKR